MMASCPDVGSGPAALGRRPLCFRSELRTAVNLEICVAFESALVIREQFHRITWLHLVALDRLINLGLQSPDQLRLIPLSHTQHVCNRGPFDRLLNIPTT